MWTIGLPHRSGLPHLPGVPHLHVDLSPTSTSIFIPVELNLKEGKMAGFGKLCYKLCAYNSAHLNFGV